MLPTGGTGGTLPGTSTTLTGTGTTGQMMMDLGIPDMGGVAGMLQFGRWTLYDKDAMFVKAIASPTTYAGSGNVEFGTYEFSCVYINFWDTDYIGMIYELTSGNPKPCYKNYASWKEASPYFKDANCTQGAGYTLPGYPPSVLQVNGTLYYVTTNNLPVAQIYTWNAMQNTCMVSNVALEFYEYKQVPSWTLEIMDAPPYSMVLEY